MINLLVILFFIGLDHFNDPKASIKYSNDVQDVYKNIEEYKIGKKCKVLIVFDYMIADMINYKKLNPAVTELFIRIVYYTLFYCENSK